MKQRRIPGIADVFEVNDPAEILALANSDAVDRHFEGSTCPFNWFILKRSLGVLSFRGLRLPTMQPRNCPSRARAQNELWSKLNSQIEVLKAGPPTLTFLAQWVRGVSPVQEVGILAQDFLGKLFRDDFNATEETWAAARILVKAPRSANLPMLGWWFVTGKVKRAKLILASTVDGDLSAVNAIGIAVHNLGKSLEHMRSLYSELNLRRTLTARGAAESCLRAPMSVYRQATKDGHLGGAHFRENSLFVLNIGSASQVDGGRGLIFMEESWSRCPAAKWIPAMLEGVWRQALRQEASGLEVPNGEGRPWSQAIHRGIPSNAPGGPALRSEASQKCHSLPS